MLSLFFFVFDIKKVRGFSMFPSIKNGEIVLIFRAYYGIKFPWKGKYMLKLNKLKKGDVVMYRLDGRNVIKRVALVGGESLGEYEKYGEKYLLLEHMSIKLNAENFRTLFGDGSNIKVPENTFLALGDNLGTSEDSRHYGFVFQSDILGKVLCK